MGVLAVKKFNSLGPVNDGFAVQQIFHKVLQPGTGDNDDLRGFGGANLFDVQGIVVQAGYALRYQPGHGNSGTLAQPGGKFIHRQSSGGDLRRFLLSGTAG